MRLVLIAFSIVMLYIRKVLLKRYANTKERGKKVYNSKAYYGATFLEREDLKETNINHRIELEYYTTKNHINRNTKEESVNYGIEIIKKEYKDDKIDTETNNREYISNNAEKVIEIIETLKRHTVTPIGLNDVLDDLLKAN